ncbi:hypothetical protein BOW32_11860 [Solemya velum gill symbiont]|uniref:hypothetical protein n=1 Tax=Solemya velum gill symbiont TaxID=2340 RepID=UPI000997A931|nr:hypothetical protein [Solemya velum gill symbiont]OOZ24258.1 hypothetical protein BOW32_11860 [Solemya velum gill symbiont]
MTSLVDVETWKKFFADMVAGKLRPNDRGNYHVATIQTGGNGVKPTIKMVTPTAQAVEIAKSELTDERKDHKSNPVPRKRKSSNGGYKSKTKPKVYKKKLAPKKTQSKKGKIPQSFAGPHIFEK